jgi:PST family polysaccharide transporter
VNEQAQVSLLLAVPGVLATLTLAPLAIALFYSAQFSGSISILRWICLGMAVRVLTWPIGYIVVAKNVQVLFLAIEVAWTMVNVGLTWWFVKAYGVDGTGMAFFGANVLHALAVYPIVRRLSGFRWSASNLKLAAQCFVLTTITFTGFQVLAPMQATAVGLVTTLASAWISVRTLTALVSPNRLPSRLQRFFRTKRNAG